jgi:hypothetical protein
LPGPTSYPDLGRSPAGVGGRPGCRELRDTTLAPLKTWPVIGDAPSAGWLHRGKRYGGGAALVALVAPIARFPTVANPVADLQVVSGPFTGVAAAGNLTESGLWRGLDAALQEPNQGFPWASLTPALQPPTDRID